MWDDIQLRDVRMFLTLAEELHFGRAATRLGVTTSRVSQTIRALERRVGGSLFYRTSRTVRLTALGEHLRAELAPGYDRMRRGWADTVARARGISGTLRLGMYSPILGGPSLVEIVKEFQAHHPECRVQLIETGFTRDQLDWLRRDDVDMLAMRLPLVDPDIVVGPLLSREARVVLVARDHPLAPRGTVVYDELAPYTVSDGSLPRAVMDSFMPPVTPSGHRLARTFVHSIGEAVMRVAVGEIVHPTVASFLDHHPHPDIVALPISDLPPSETALVWLRAGGSARVDAFAAIASQPRFVPGLSGQRDEAAVSAQVMRGTSDQSRSSS